jgi:putative DNA primase/helicase
VIRALIGPSNVVSPTLSSLAMNFGLAPLLGKPAAVITDARISGRTDTAVVVERLLTISGEDAQTVDRKHREAVTTKLPTRFMLVSNELPRMKDASGALVGRMIFLQLTNSFYGREDVHLIDRLLPELPGILRWTIQGWARLRKRGKFIQPSAADGLLMAMETLASPIKSFLKDRCKVDPEASESIQNLFLQWKFWCMAKGQEHIGNDDDFGRNLRAALPTLKKIRPYVDGVRTYSYKGLRLLTEAELNDLGTDPGTDDEAGDATEPPDLEGTEVADGRSNEPYLWFEDQDSVPF